MRTFIDTFATFQRSHARAATRLLAGALGVMVLAASPAMATHFRYGHVSWQHVGAAASKTIEFTLQAAWRQDGISHPSGSNVYRCVNPANFVNQSTKLPTVPCTGPVIAGKANPGVGDVFVEDIGNVFFDFGDNHSAGGPGGDPLLFKVTSADPANNWVFALALDTNSLPAVDTSIQHTYTFNGATKAFTAGISDCCRISACTAPNAHMNNPDTNYAVQTTVIVGSGDSSPVSSLPPIVLCPQNGLCTFQVPVSDNELDPISFRLSTTTEAGFTSQPGAPQCPHAAAINASTGLYSWDTTGCRTAGDATPQPPAGGCGAADASFNTLYSTQVMIQEPTRNTKTPVDFFIQLVPTCSLNSAPAFNPPTPLCGSTVSAHPNAQVSFSVQASDANAGDAVSLNAAGVPQGGTLSPGLPTSGNPVNSTFSWTPASGDLGQHVVTFTATDPCGAQALCSITLDVSQEICGDGIDNDGDGLIDCFDPDCAGTPCDDGNACTGNDACSGGPSGCVGGPTISCDDGNVCTTDACNPASGCTHTPNSNACDDGNACTRNDTCSGGSCIGGAAPNCDDGNACTADSCDQVLGCQHGLQPNCQPCSGDADCDDHNACDGTERCVAGQCQSGAAPNCDDGNVCTDDSCNPASGCVHVNNTAPCDDGNACTTGDTCSAGTCAGGPPPNCDDGNVCTDDSCDQALGCQHSNNTAPCSDGNACTTGDTCRGGSCVSGPAADCDDNNLCTDDTCNPASGCVNAPNTNPCDDGSQCTTNDTCSNGQCVGGASLACDDGNVCTDDSCNPASGCVYTPNAGPCNDGNACTTNDTCNGGQCAGGAALNCDDGNACTDDSCNPASGCTHANNNAPCNDGNTCTTNDTCSGGGCVGGPALNCNDGNVCTDDSCNPASGCVHTNNTAPCSDGNACTANDTCAGGTCVSGPTLSCNDNNACTTDSCDPARGCQNTQVVNCQPCATNADCDDHNACDGTELCVAGRCQNGTPPNCDDANLCTDDSCNPASGCVHTNNNLPCSDGNACTTNDACSGGRCVGGPALNCNDNNVCTTDACDPTSGCTHANNTVACDDGSACTQNDTCRNGVCAGTAIVCSAADQCHTAGTCNPQTGACSNPAKADGTACNDGHACTRTDTCEGGLCVGAQPVDCSALSDQCNTGTCVEPSGTCVRNAKVDGLACNASVTCSIHDKCHTGVCVRGPMSGDSDGDGYCDAREAQALCNAHDAREIPPQPAVYSGGRVNTAGEILLTYESPGDQKVITQSDISCAAAGACDSRTNFCTVGRIGDACAADTDCDQPEGFCRVLINYAGTPDITLLEAKLKMPRHPAVDVLALFQPVVPGCSRKVDLPLPPGFKRATLRLKAQGTTGGKVRKDRDRVNYREQ